MSGSAAGHRSREVTYLAIVALLIGCGMNAPRKQRRSSDSLTARPANATCVAPQRPASRAVVARVFPNASFDEPVSLAASPDYNWWYVGERGGRVWRIDARVDSATPELVLDITDRVNASTGSIGILAIAVHPDFARTGALFVSYTGFGGKLLMSRVSRFVSVDGGRTFARGSEERLFDIDQAADYHVNTDLRFGPDGFLYIGFGDGGPQGDPHRRAQNPHSLRGKILRIDVSARTLYKIPADNPYARGGGRPEVWALGLRNPWRFSFDAHTGELWAGDVGGDHFEEIDRIVRAGNYGWHFREATRCVDPKACDGPKLIDPVLALAHPEVSSVTFGMVYRGTAMPELYGRLLYADYASGVLWEADPAERRPRMLNGDGHAIVSFAADAAGEPIAVDLRGALWRIQPGNAGPKDIPTLLSETGCFHRNGEPASGLIPYDVNVGFWSDGAAKQRWFAIPDNQQIEIRPDGHLELPIGSVVVKEFELDGIRVETRLLVRHADGDWAGYTYAWDATQVDARLLPASATALSTTLPKQWKYPHRGECVRCHQADTRTLGLTLPQLARPIEVGGQEVDQLAVFERIGLLAQGVPPVRPLPTVDASIEQRARAWLDVNCAYCHRPGATGQGDMDMRYATPLAEMGLCNIAPRFGLYGQSHALRVAPGNARQSMLSRRIRSTSFIRMPPLGSMTFDRDGAALIDEWIGQLKCE